MLQACSEGSLFTACMAWADQPDRCFDEVEQLLPLIRFPLMTHQELQVSQPCLVLCFLLSHLSPLACPVICQAISLFTDSKALVKSNIQMCMASVTAVSATGSCCNPQAEHAPQ